MEDHLAVGMRVGAAHQAALVLEYLYMVDVVKQAELLILPAPHPDHFGNLAYAHIRHGRVVPGRYADHLATACIQPDIAPIRYGSCEQNKKNNKKKKSTAVGLGDEEVVLVELHEVAISAPHSREVVVEHVRTNEHLIFLSLSKIENYILKYPYQTNKKNLARVSTLPLARVLPGQR
jgi:hypothetical protein